MATRRSEWLASIKPILDRDGAKKDAAALAKELGDILEIKVGASSENLEDLAKEFNAQLKTMGKQPIVFSEKTIRGIVSQFTQAIASGINGSIEESMNKLRKERDKIVAEQRALEARKQKLKGVRDFAYDLSSATKNETKAFNLDEINAMKKAASDIGQSFDDFVLEMKSNVEQLQLKLGKIKIGTPEFDSAIKDFYEQTYDLFRMSRTLSKHPGLVIDKEIIEEFSFDNLQYLFGDEIDDRVDAFERSLNRVYTTLSGFKTRLNDIDVELQSIQSKGGEIIDETKARNGLKTLNEIKKAYEDIRVDKSTRIDKRYADQIQAALNFDPNKSGEGIKSLYTQYQSAKASGDWVAEYRALLKYVRLYESYMTTANKTHSDKITKRGNVFTPLYNELKPMADNARNMLQNIINLGEEKPLIGLGGAGQDGVQAGPSDADVDNARKLREESEAKKRAEAEAFEIAKQKRAEEEAALAAAKEKNALLKKSEDDDRVPGSILNNPMFANMFKKSTAEANDKRVANEASAEAAQNELEAVKQTTDELEKQQKILMYRRVEGDFDPNRISSRSIDALYNKKNQPIIQEALEYGFGGFGDGLYGSVLGGAENLALDTSGKTSFIEFDASDYNFYINKTVEQAESLREFLLSLQKLVGANTLLDPSKLTDIKDLSEDQLFEKAQQIFKNFSMSKEQFHTWLENAKKESEMIADLFAQGKVPEDRHNFGTRFMKTLGYQGVLNDTGDDEYDGNYQGSVIYDPDVDKVKSSLTVFNTTSEYLERLGAAAQSATQSIDNLTADGSSDDVEAVKAELEKQKLENVALQERVQKQADEAADEHLRHLEERSELRMQAEYAEEEAAAAKERANNAEAEAERLRKESEGKKLVDQNAPDSADELISLQTQLEDERQMRVATENALSDTLSEKWAAEKRAEEAEAKISNATAMDDSTLEATLTKVFANILNPKTQQNDSEQTEKHWALESTLQTVKSVLESIENKIVDGGKIVNRDGAKQLYKGTQKDTEPTQTARSNVMKSLINDYKTMGKLAAQFANDGNLQTKAMLDNLKEEIARKRRSLKITMDENSNLREKYSIAFDAEKRLLDAEKAQKEINARNKADAKEAETAWKKQVKDAQRATGINAATTAANAGDQTVLRAIGAEGVSKDIENKAKELSDQIKALRMLRDEIDKKGEKASDADRDNLSKQISKVKELKTEVDGYLKIHEKYSGDNVTDLGDASNFGAVGTDQYWNNITAAIQNASTGRVAIKGMDADTGELTGTTKIAANTFATWSATVDPLTGRLSMLRTGIKKTETIIEQITRKTKEIFTYFSGSSIIFKAFNELKKGVQYVRDIDLALTELKKVTDEAEETYDKFLQTAAKTGARLGSTISAVTEATATFAKLGYSMEQASEMAEAAIVYKNVGDNIASTEDAADSIISTLKGFGLEASESMAIVDRFNEVGNKFAITSQGIGEALRLSASALNEGGNSLDESIALITAANEVVNDPSSVGTALKTLTLRLRGSKTELEEMGEDVSDMATTTSQLQAKLLALTGGQVDIMLDENTFKNSTQILREMADAWEDMNDIQRASALELMGGKRQANVLSALIQNFDTVEDAIAISADSAGSALKENERYLNSIQGKIDQFTNATQAMWSNFLDSDVVKFVVDLGTKLIKLVDTIGVIPSSLAGILVYLTAFKKQNPLDWIQSITQYLSAFRGKGGLTQFLGQLLGIAPAMKIVTAETIANTVATQTNDIAKQKQILSTLGLQNATGTLSLAQKEEAKTAIMAAVANGSMDAQFGANMLAALGYSASLGVVDGQIKIVDASTKSFMASNPVGWILAIVSAVVVLVTLLSKIPSDLERLENKMSDLNSEITNLESEIDSLNSELETTQDRISELLAMPSLSFVEQEELKNLQLQNAELERQLKLQEMLLESKKKDRISTSKEWVQNVWNGEGLDQKYFVSGNGTIGEDKWFSAGTSGKEALEVSLPKYAELQKSMEGWEDTYLAAQKELNDNGKLSYETFKGVVDTLPDIGDNPEAYYDQKARYSDEKLVELFKQRIIDQNNKTINNMTSGIEMVLDDMSKVISDNELSYSMGDEDVNKFLDEYFAYQYAYQEAQGISAKSSAIASIFDDTSSDGIQKLKEDLSSIAGDDSLDAAKKQSDALELVQQAINSTSGDYDRLKTSMDIIGISADEVARYFVQLSKMPDSGTIEGVTAQYQKGVDALSKYKDNANAIISEFTNLDGTIEQITFDDLFKDGEVIDTQISKVLQGADETTRNEFARIVKSIKDGTMDIDNAITSFSASGLVSVSKLIEESFGELNQSVFKGLEDEITGFIDTFSEFSAALEDVASSMDLLNAAQEQFDNSGQVSVKTALELMESTDRWNEVLYVENGQIKLNTEAQDILVQSKLDTVKANLAEAKASIQNQLAQLGAADATLLSAEASDVTTEAYTIYTNAMNSYTASIAGFGAALDALVNGRIFGDDGILGSFKSAYNATKEVKTYENNTSITDLRKRLSEVETMEDFFEGVDTAGEFADNYDFDKNPGDKYEDSQNDRFQREMDYWENRIAASQAKYEQLQNEIDLMEAKGQKADASFFDKQIALEKERLDLLNRQKAAAEGHLFFLEAGSEEWWEVANTLNDIEGELDDVTASIVDLQDAIGEIDAYKFEEFNTRLDDLASKLQTIRNLIAPDGEEDWFSEDGSWTEEGVAVLGSYLQELETYKQGYVEIVDELNKYSASYEGNEAYYETLGIHSEQELYDKTEELISQQYDFAESISDTEQSVVDMYESSIDAVEEYVDTLIDGYNDYIDSVKEALDAERDYTLWKQSDSPLYI